MAEKTMDDLFLHTLKDVYFAERQILKNLPKMIKAAKAPALKEGLTHHRAETEGQIERLESIFDMLGKRAQGVTCEAIKGILEEGEEGIEDFGGSPVGDAALIASAQAVEHYEITRYGSLKAWAGHLGLNDAVKLLDATLAEEKKADQLLTQVASAGMPPAAKGVATKPSRP